MRDSMHSVEETQEIHLIDLWLLNAMAFLATAVVLWLQSSYNDAIPAPKVPTTQFHPTCSIPLYSILEKTLSDVNESELHISLFDVFCHEVWKWSQLRRCKSHCTIDTFLTLNPTFRVSTA